MSKTIALFKSIKIFEIVLTLVLAVALGVAFWGWTFVYELAKPFLKIFALNYLAAGLWILASIFIAQIIQKPGIAIIASIMAAFVEGLLTHWGPISMLWGFVQGLGAEIIFFIFAYRKWDLNIMLLASGLATCFSYLLDYFFYDYKSMHIGINVIQLISYIISSFFFAGYLSNILTKRLLRLGLLDQFLIAQKRPGNV